MLVIWQSSFDIHGAMIHLDKWTDQMMGGKAN